jgi:hypothetical protein
LENLQAVNAKEAIILKRRLDLCRHASSISHGKVCAVSRRDLGLHLSALKEFAGSIAFKTKIEVANRYCTFHCEDASASTDIDEAGQKIQLFADACLPWAVSPAAVFDLTKPTFSALASEMQDAELNQDDDNDDLLLATVFNRESQASSSGGHGVSHVWEAGLVEMCF